jgi:small subunit ribosomal protein S4
MLEKQFRSTFAKAARMRGNTGDNFLSMLESRLDSFAFRAGFAPTIWAARQLTTHGHFLVNGRRINIPSYQLQPGDVVSIREKSRSVSVIKETMQATTVYPVYMSVSHGSFEGKLSERPQAQDIPVKIDMALIVEFYSR